MTRQLEAKQSQSKNKTIFENSYWFNFYTNKSDLADNSKCIYCGFPTHNSEIIICDAQSNYKLPMSIYMQNIITSKTTEHLKIITL